MKTVESIPEVEQICKANYKDNCGKCLLRPSCCRPVAPGWDAYNEWVAEKNALALKIIAEQYKETA